MASARGRGGLLKLDPTDAAFQRLAIIGPVRPEPPKGPSRVRRLFYIWLSIELAAGIIALAEIVFALPSIILLELGQATIDRALPLIAVSGTVAVYLGKSALPLVAEVARLAQSAS